MLDGEELSGRDTDDETEFVAVVDDEDFAQPVVEPSASATDVDSLLDNSDFTNAVDCLQLLGVDPVIAVRYVSSIIDRGKNKAKFLELHGTGRILVVLLSNSSNQKNVNLYSSY